MSQLNVGQFAFIYAQQDDQVSDSPILAIIKFAFFVAIVVGMWLTFQKAGKPGWAAIIPIYNLIVLLQIADKPWWWIFLFIVPVLNLIMLFVVELDVADKYGKGEAFGIGLFFLPFIFYPILGLGDASYQS